MGTHPRGTSPDGFIVAIGVFKLLKAALLVALALGAFSLLNRDRAECVTQWVNALGVDPANKYFDRFINMLRHLDYRRLREMGFGTFFYAGLFLAEGIGLVLRRCWAEYLTAIVTGSFVPLETYELVHHFSRIKILVILVNVGIVVYLITQLRRKH